ncbi:MAG: YraN family protein [Pirellulaceae bacterium]|nr:YraN family protein [Pirellulaceae bacterium]
MTLFGWLSSVSEPICLWLDRRQPLGRRGENAAARYLRRRGYVIVARGQRGQVGELDLVAVQNRTVVFVEVKTRASQDAGHPADAVDRQKQERLTRVALAYLKRHDLLECSTRFDVIAISWPDLARAPQIEHFEGAFEATGFEGMFS